jgi:hypothetical protein
MNRTARWVGLALGGAFLSLSVDAGACGNGMRGRQVHDPMRRLVFDQQEEVVVPRLQLAEGALREGNLMLAAAELDAVTSRIPKAPPRLRARFERVASLVSVRADGQWPLLKPGAENGPAARARVLQTAVTKLRQRLAASPADPIRLTDLGEALAALPKHRKEAKNILEALLSRDLLTSAHGYAALSRLRSVAKDEAGAEAALNACRKLDEKGLVCPGALPPKV